MVMHKMSLSMLFCIALLICNCTLGTAMLYKRNQQENYEADLVAVSSTVIPLTVLEVSYGAGGKPSEEYKAAYLRKLRKKVQRNNAAKQSASATVGGSGVPLDADDIDETELPIGGDTLITVKSKQHEASKAKVKGITR